MDVISVVSSLVVGTARRGSVARVIQTALKPGLPLAPSGGVNVVDVLDVVDTLIAAMDRGGLSATLRPVTTSARGRSCDHLPPWAPCRDLTLPASFTGSRRLWNLWSQL